MAWNKEGLGKEIILELYQKGMIKTWYRDKPDGWTLISGIWSPFYIQLRLLPSYPILLKKVGHALGELIKEECKTINRIIGVANAGIPISSAISIVEGIPSCYSRKLEGIKSIESFNDHIKKYGEHSMIEGILNEGDRIGIIDDLVTKFDSKLIAIKQLELEIKLRKLKNVKCSDIIVLFDREQGAEKSSKDYGIKLHSLIPFMSKGLNWLKEEITTKEYEVIIDYLRNNKKYQNSDLKKKLYDVAKNKKT